MRNIIRVVSRSEHLRCCVERSGFQRIKSDSSV